MPVINAELQSVAQFLTGSPLASAVPWRQLGSEDLRIVRRWAGEVMPHPAQRRLMRELRHAIRCAEAPEDVPDVAAVSPGLLRAHHSGRAAAPIPARTARLLLEACREAGDATARRDGALISLMLLAGLRRQEVVSLRRGDYDDADGRVEVKTRRHGRRSVLLEGECLADLEHWLAERGSGGGPLFLAYNGRGAPLPKGIAASSVNRILARRCAEAGIGGLTPEALRGRFLWQLQGGVRQGNGQACRYYLSEDGQPGWALASLPGV